MSNSSSELIFHLRKRLEELETNLLTKEVSNRDGQRLINDLNHQLAVAKRREAASDSRLHDVATLCATVEQERDQLKSRVNTLEDALALTGWQLITTAPKNCVEVLLKFENGNEHIGHFAENLSGEEQPAFSGWFEKCGSYFRGFSDEPILWQPLQAIAAKEPK